MSNIVGIDIPQNGDGQDTSYVTKMSDSLSAINTHDHAAGSGLPVKRVALSAVNDTTVTSTSGVISIKPLSIGSTEINISAGLPVGSITYFCGSSPPTGWLVCDGSEVSRTTYANLFAVISTRSGVGNGSTTFNLPDCRGMFMRGFDSSGVRDSSHTTRYLYQGVGTPNGFTTNVGAVLGSLQQGSIKDHTHNLTEFAGAQRIAVEGGAGNFKSGGSGQYGYDIDTFFGATAARKLFQNTKGSDTSGPPVGTGKQFRPENFSMNMVIKT
jgi:microcystin-dependent protein